MFQRYLLLGNIPFMIDRDIKWYTNYVVVGRFIEQFY